VGLAAQFAASMAAQRHPVEVPLGDGKVTLYVRELVYLEAQDEYAQARLKNLSALGLLVAAAVEGEGGERFTFEEVMRLRQDVAAPLFAEVARLQRIGDGAAKS
jgi:hypothetical protein